MPRRLKARGRPRIIGGPRRASGSLGKPQPSATRALARGGIGNTSGSGPEDSRFESWRANQGTKQDRTKKDAEGWPSGLRRRPAKALTRESLVGSNPTPSACSRYLRHTRRLYPDGWPSGLRRTPGERVGSNPASWVRIPPRPLCRAVRRCDIRRGGRTAMHRSRKPAPSRACGFESHPLRWSWKVNLARRSGRGPDPGRPPQRIPPAAAGRRRRSRRPHRPGPGRNSSG